jgi:hypothetical protein
MTRLTSLVLLLALAWASPALAGPPVRCTSTYSPTLQRWTTTITASPRQACTGQVNPRTQQVEVRCR